MSELVLRFFIGGCVVSLFALIGGVFKPASFAGIFGAAPSVAVATLGLAIAHKGGSYAATECGSMMCGAAALFLFSVTVCHLILHFRIQARLAAILSMAVWAGCAAILFRLIK